MKLFITSYPIHEYLMQLFTYVDRSNLSVTSFFFNGNGYNIGISPSFKRRLIVKSQVLHCDATKNHRKAGRGYERFLRHSSTV